MLDNMVNFVLKLPQNMKNVATEYEEVTIEYEEVAI